MPERERYPGPIEWLTVPGRLLLIAAIVGFVATFYFYFVNTIADFPTGRYPVVMWVLPVAAAWGAFFFLAAFILERLGLSIYRRDE